MVGIKKEAALKVKENFLSLSNVLESHKTVLLSMVDDILYRENDYFEVKYNGPQIKDGRLNDFYLQTTALYTGIVSQHSPIDLKKIVDRTLPYRESCFINFDNSQNITEVMFEIIKRTPSGVDSVRLYLDKDFNLFDFSWQSKKKFAPFTNKVFNFKDLPLSDIISFLKLQFNINENLIELFPELTIPSAYNFNADEFKDRLELANMLLD